MVIRRLHPLRWWISIAIVFLMVSMAVPIGVNLWYTRVTVQHACTALNYLRMHPTHSKIFNHDIRVWAQSDGC